MSGLYESCSVFNNIVSYQYVKVHFSQAITIFKQISCKTFIETVSFSLGRLNQSLKLMLILCFLWMINLLQRLYNLFFFMRQLDQFLGKILSLLRIQLGFFLLRHVLKAMKHEKGGLVLAFSNFTPSHWDLHRIIHTN